MRCYNSWCEDEAQLLIERDAARMEVSTYDPELFCEVILLVLLSCCFVDDALPQRVLLCA